MQKNKILTKLIIAVLILTAGNVLNAQQVINFYALEEPYNVLTKADVDAILEEEWEGGEFVANFNNELTIIGDYAFNSATCYNHLVEAEGKNISRILWMSFYQCWSLTSINFPNIVQIGFLAFSYCYSLKIVKLGTELKEGTETYFHNTNQFDFAMTSYINLILGPYMDPPPNLTNNTWLYSSQWYDDSIPYTWNSINVVGIKEDKTDDNVYCVGKNLYCIYGDDILLSGLYDMSGKRIIEFINERIIDLNDIFVGVYFLRYYKNNKIKTKKIIIY